MTKPKPRYVAGSEKVLGLTIINEPDIAKETEEENK